MKVFLTGSTGFVGSHLLHLENPDVFIHAAGAIDANFDFNVRGTAEAIERARAMGAKRFIYLSTGGMYRPSDEPLTEESPVEPKSEYAKSKWEGEQLVLRSGLRAQILRLFFPYGPGQRAQRFIPRLIDRIRRGEPITAGPRMNPIYIDDLVEFIRRILPIDEDFVLNLAGPQIVSIREIAEEIGRLVGVAPNIASTNESAESWIGDVAHAARITGYASRITMKEGLTRLLK